MVTDLQIFHLLQRIIYLCSLKIIYQYYYISFQILPGYIQKLHYTFLTHVTRDQKLSSQKKGFMK
jgi:hypothetical protein